MHKGLDHERTPSSGNFDIRELDVLARGGLIGLVGISISLILNFIYQFILAKILGAAELGIFNLGLTISGLIGLVIGFGLDRSIVRFVATYVGISDREREVGAIFCTFVFLFFTTVLITPFFWIVADRLGNDIFHKPNLIPVLRILIIGTPFVSFTRVGMGILQSYKRIKPIAAIEQTLVPILRIAFFLLAIVTMGRVSNAAANSFTVASIAGFVISFVFVWRLYISRKGSRTPAFLFKELLGFSWLILLAALLNRTNNFTETLVLGGYSSSQEVGIYSLSLKIATTITIFSEAMSMIFMPFIADLFFKGDLDRLSFLLKTVTRWAFTLTLPLALLLFIMSYDFLAVIGQEYVRGWIVLRILIVSQLLFAVTEPAAMVLIMTRYNRLNLIDLLLALILSLILDFGMIPKYGALGAAYAGTITIGFVNLLRLVQIFKYMHIHPFQKNYVKPLFAGAISTMVVVGLKYFTKNISDHWQLIILVSILMVVYFLILIALGQNQEDRDVLVLFWRKLSGRVS